MKLTPAAANLLVGAADRADRIKRAAALMDMRAAIAQDPKQANEILRSLRK